MNNTLYYVIIHNINLCYVHFIAKPISKGVFMKKNSLLKILISMSFMILALSFAGCSNDDDDSNSGGASTTVLSGKSYQYIDAEFPTSRFIKLYFHSSGNDVTLSQPGDSGVPATYSVNNLTITVVANGKQMTFIYNSGTDSLYWEENNCTLTRR